MISLWFPETNKEQKQQKRWACGLGGGVGSPTKFPPPLFLAPHPDPEQPWTSDFPARRIRKSQENLRNHSEHVGKCSAFFGSCVCNLCRRDAQKLRGIIVVRFGLMAFRFRMGKPSNPTFLWFRSFRTCLRVPKPILSIFGDTRTWIIQDKAYRAFEHASFIHSGMWEIRKHFITKNGLGTSR